MIPWTILLSISMGKHPSNDFTRDLSAIYCSYTVRKFYVPISFSAKKKIKSERCLKLYTKTRMSTE